MIENIKQIIYKYKIVVITTLLLIILTGVNIYLILDDNKEIIEITEQPFVEEVSIKDNNEIQEQKPKKIKIDIKGEIKKPGVYELYEGDRVIEAINISGGLTDKADTSLLNLSKNLKDEMVIIIYNKDVIKELKKEEIKTETVIKYIEKECVCPDTINDACINKEEDKEETNTAKKEEISEKISLNTASIEELTTLTGIGEEKAKAIIEYRNTNGNFKSIEEIMNIKGIGESTFEKFKHQVTV